MPEDKSKENQEDNQKKFQAFYSPQLKKVSVMQKDKLRKYSCPDKYNNWGGDKIFCLGRRAKAKQSPQATKNTLYLKVPTRVNLSDKDSVMFNKDLTDMRLLDATNFVSSPSSTNAKNDSTVENVTLINEKPATQLNPDTKVCQIKNSSKKDENKLTLPLTVINDKSQSSERPKLTKKQRKATVNKPVQEFLQVPTFHSCLETQANKSCTEPNLKVPVMPTVKNINNHGNFKICQRNESTEISVLLNQMEGDDEITLQNDSHQHHKEKGSCDKFVEISLNESGQNNEYESNEENSQKNSKTITHKEIRETHKEIRETSFVSPFDETNENNMYNGVVRNFSQNIIKKGCNEITTNSLKISDNTDNQSIENENKAEILEREEECNKITIDDNNLQVFPHSITLESVADTKVDLFLNNNDLELAGKETDQILTRNEAILEDNKTKIVGYTGSNVSLNTYEFNRASPLLSDKDIDNIIQNKLSDIGDYKYSSLEMQNDISEENFPLLLDNENQNGPKVR